MARRETLISNDFLLIIGLRQYRKRYCLYCNKAEAQHSVALRPCYNIEVEIMRLIFVVGVVGVLVLSALLYSWYTGEGEEEDDDEMPKYVNLKSTIGVDEGTEMVQLTLKITNNYPLTWNGIGVTVGGSSVSGGPIDEDGQQVETTHEGESALWRFPYEGGKFKVGDAYTIKVIEIAAGILWQKDVVAIAMDIPAPEA